MKFTETHEWITVEEDVATVGITAYAQKELGDIVYVELPKTGSAVKKSQEAAVLESTKAAADVYAPISGKILAVNKDLETHPEYVNSYPQKEGWLFKMSVNDAKEYEALMDEGAYQNMLGS